MYQRVCSCSSAVFRNYGTRQESRPWKQRPNRKPRLTLILSEDVANLGNRGEMVHVKRGYGRNFLLPKGKAVYATQENMKQYNTVEKRLFIPRRGTAKVKVDQKLGGTEFIASFLKGKTVIIEQDEQEIGWDIYEFQIANALRKQLQCHAPIDSISIPLPITTFGSTHVQLKVDDETEISLSVEVVPLPEHKRKTSEEIERENASVNS